MRRPVFSGVFAAISMLLSVSSSHALPFTYLYKGNDFTDVSAPYTTADFVSGQFTVELASNLNVDFANISDKIQSFSFSDGQQTFTENTPLANAIFFISTDGSGNIVDWNVGLDIIPVRQINTKNEFGTQIDLASLTDYKRGLVENNPGTWTQVSDKEISEPSTIALLASGFLLLLSIAYWRRFEKMPRLAAK